MSAAAAAQQTPSDASGSADVVGHDVIISRFSGRLDTLLRGLAASFPECRATSDAVSLYAALVGSHEDRCAAMISVWHAVMEPYYDHIRALHTSTEDDDVRLDDVVAAILGEEPGDEEKALIAGEGDGEGAAFGADARRLLDVRGLLRTIRLLDKLDDPHFGPASQESLVEYLYELNTLAFVRQLYAVVPTTLLEGVQNIGASMSIDTAALGALLEGGPDGGGLDPAALAAMGASLGSIGGSGGDGGGMPDLGALSALMGGGGLGDLLGGASGATGENGSAPASGPGALLDSLGVGAGAGGSGGGGDMMSMLMGVTGGGGDGPDVMGMATQLLDSMEPQLMAALFGLVERHGPYLMHIAQNDMTLFREA